MKEKLHYIKWFPSDYIKDTRCLTLTARGAWVDLLMFMWDAPQRGVLETNIQIIARLLSCSSFQAKKILQEIFSKNICDFYTTKGEVFSPNFLKKNTEFFLLVNRRAARDSTFGAKSTEKKEPKKESTHLALAIDSSNSTVFNTKKESDFFSKKEVHDALFGDELWIESLSMAYPGKDLEEAFSEMYLHHSESPNPPRKLWQWRQKLNTWLTIKPPKHERKGKPGPYDHVIAAAKDFANRHGTQDEP